jgi:cell wall-associated NlpC family hydrolase
MKKKLFLGALLTLSLLPATSYAATYDQYTIADHDVFSSIAQRAGVSVSALSSANPLVNPKNLYHGLMISLPAGHKPMNGVTPVSAVSRKTYTVQLNDTFWTISQKFNVSYSYLITANPKVKNPTSIYPGLMLNIPTAPFPAQAYDSRTRIEGIIALAKDQLGTPYIWGGSTPWVGLDCSGLTQYVFGKYGISLPHKASMQFQSGTPVAKNQLRRGDLVFFKEHGSSTITHVGIYLGNDQMIDADTDPQNGVQITNVFGDAYYSACYAGAKRYIN